MWTDEDIEAALEWQAEQDSRCPGCGHPRDEAWVEDGPDYVAESRRCRACESTQMASGDMHREAHEAGQQVNGMYFYAREVNPHG